MYVLAYELIEPMCMLAFVWCAQMIITMIISVARRNELKRECDDEHLNSTLREWDGMVMKVYRWLTVMWIVANIIVAFIVGFRSGVFLQ